LVIGNANYQDSALPKLPNTINDAQDISAALEKLGYKVVLKNDLNQIAMTREERRNKNMK
jgi:uncharacterized caspase-like protein